jgi:pimeloyl-ACP methyl ester carboxylesterase
MASSLPIVLVPGLLCSARLYAPQVEALWPCGPVTVADHRRDADIGAVAGRILDAAPPRFALAGLSYGGYLAFAMLRQAPERIARLALLDTSARPDTAEQSANRERLIALTQAGKFDEAVATLAPRFVHANRRDDEALMANVRAMAAETGPDAFVLQQRAIMSRGFAAAAVAGRLPDLGAGGRGRRADAAGACARDRRRHRRIAPRRRSKLRTSFHHRAASAGEHGAGAVAHRLSCTGATRAL